MDLLLVIDLFLFIDLNLDLFINIINIWLLFHKTVRILADQPYQLFFTNTLVLNLIQHYIIDNLTHHLFLIVLKFKQLYDFITIQQTFHFKYLPIIVPIYQLIELPINLVNLL